MSGKSTEMMQKLDLLLETQKHQDQKLTQLSGKIEEIQTDLQEVQQGYKCSHNYKLKLLKQINKARAENPNCKMYVISRQITDSDEWEYTIINEGEEKNDDEKKQIQLVKDKNSTATNPGTGKGKGGKGKGRPMIYRAAPYYAPNWNGPFGKGGKGKGKGYGYRLY